MFHDLTSDERSVLLRAARILYARGDKPTAKLVRESVGAHPDDKKPSTMSQEDWEQFLKDRRDPELQR